MDEHKKPLTGKHVKDVHKRSVDDIKTVRVPYNWERYVDDIFEPISDVAPVNSFYKDI